MNLLKMINEQHLKGLVSKQSNFKYQPRKKRLTATNNYLDLETLKAYSYDWWCYFTPVAGLLVFNSGKYSVSTSKHQTRMKRLLRTLGLTIDIEMNTTGNIAGITLNNLILHLKAEQARLYSELATCKRKVSFKRTNLVDQILVISEYLHRTKGAVK